MIDGHDQYDGNKRITLCLNQCYDCTLFTVIVGYFSRFIAGGRRSNKFNCHKCTTYTMFVGIRAIDPAEQMIPGCK